MQLMRLHGPRFISIKPHKCLLPWVDCSPQFFEFIEAHFTRVIPLWSEQVKENVTFRRKTRRFSNHESRLLSRAHFCNHCNIRLENTSKYVDTLILFSKNLNQRSLTPTWPLTPCLLRSHVSLYPRIIVSKSHDNTSMYVDTVFNFANYHIHTHTTYILHTTYRMSDHIVSYWNQFRRDNYWTQFRRDKNPLFSNR